MAIVKPEKMNFSNKNIIMIISGLPGTGKTTLALSAPGVLLIDADEGMCRVRPEHRKDASICKTYEEILADINEARGHYKTIVIDTAGALIDYIKDYIIRNPAEFKGGAKASGGISLQGFGYVKQEFLRLCADLRKDFNVIFLFHEQMTKVGEDTFYELLCEGAAKTLVYQPADLAAHLFINEGIRTLGFTPTQNYTAKSAYGIKGLMKVPELKEGDSNDFLTRLFAQVRENLEAEAGKMDPKKEAYEIAMQNGKALIDSVTDTVSADAVAKEIKKLNHSLTSKTELGDMFKDKIASIGVKYDSKAKAFVNIEKEEK